MNEITPLSMGFPSTVTVPLIVPVAGPQPAKAARVRTSNDE
jgi:hypothetical protein